MNYPTISALSVLALSLSSLSLACDQEANAVADAIATGSITTAVQYFPGPERPTYSRQLADIRSSLQIDLPAERLDEALSGVFYRISVGEAELPATYRQNRFNLNSAVLNELSLTIYSTPAGSTCEVLQVHFDSPSNDAGAVFEQIFMRLELRPL